jgi:multicomponent Na+:H+ antiporter subunit E
LRTGLWLVLAWAIWSGRTEPWLIALGAVSCLFVLVASVRLGLVDEETEPLGLGLRPALYLPWLLWQVLRSNLHVLAVIVGPRSRIRPRLVTVEARQRTSIGQVIHAQSITLTPGTVSLDLRDRRILVHALTDEAARGVGEGAIDRKVCWLEGPGR